MFATRRPSSEGSSQQSRTPAPAGSNGHAPQFSSLRERLRFDKVVAVILESEKDGRRAAAGDEARVRVAIGDEHCRRVIMAESRAQGRRSLAASEEHYRGAVLAERDAWCLVVLDLMRGYDATRGVGSRGAQASASAFPLQRDQSSLAQDCFAGAASPHQQSSPVITAAPTPLDALSLGRTDRRLDGSPNTGGGTAASPKPGEGSSVRRAGSSRRHGTSTATTAPNERANPFASIIARDASGCDASATAAAAQLAAVSAARIDVMLALHAHRNGEGTDVVRRAAASRKRELIAAAIDRKKDVHLSTLQRSSP